MSCYFQSIGTLLNISTNIVRKNVCDFMINTLQDENSEYFELLNVWFENENDEGNGIERYIQSMQRGSTWGGGPELAATCLVYNKSIRITNLRKNQKYPIMNIEGSSNDLDILNISWSGNHYEPIAIITPDDEAFSYNFEEEIEEILEEKSQDTHIQNIQTQNTQTQNIQTESLEKQYEDEQANLGMMKLERLMHQFDKEEKFKSATISLNRRYSLQKQEMQNRHDEQNETIRKHRENLLRLKIMFHA
jgi:hypothetical protein